LLPDSGRLQEEANYANRRGYSKHAPALPLYTEAEAWQSLDHFSAVSFDAPFETAGCRLIFRHAGHILALLQCWWRQRPVPEVVYVEHGEPAAAEALRTTITRELKWNAVVPRYLERLRLD